MSKLFMYSQYVVAVAQILFAVQLPFIGYHIIKAAKHFVRSY